MNPEPRRISWRQHLIALFVTFHVVCILIEALPRPPDLSRAALEHPEVKAEMAEAAGALCRLLPWDADPDEIRETLLDFAKGYDRSTQRARDLVAPYVETVGSSQSWHMFGGTPPRFPLVFVVAVAPEGEDDFVLFQDLRWGTADSAKMNFRHRKTQELLQRGGPRDWDAYAAYWARRWDELHPGRPARRVRLSYLRLHTPAPADVRRGEADRRPEPDLQPHLWERRP